MGDFVVRTVPLDTLSKPAEIKIIPEDQIEDRFLPLASEGGLIHKNTYEDFILADFVTNLAQLLVEIQKHPELFSIALDFRKELLENIYELNPCVLPENIYISTSGKLVTEEKEKYVRLDENRIWEASSFEDAPPSSKNSDASDSIRSFENPFDDLEYETESEWWDRLKMYVVIRQYDEEACQSILTSRYFHDKTAFQSFVVIVCVEDFDKLFEIIDSFGVSRRIAPPVLMKELYDLCVKVNPSLVYDRAQHAEGPDDDDEDDMDAPGNPFARRGRSRGRTMAAGKKSGKNKRKKPAFKDVKRSDLMTLSKRIKKRIVGQDEAVDLVVEAIQRASVGLRDPDQPIGSFIFTGPTGIGKTETTKILTEELAKDRRALIKIDCSEYSSDHEYAKLIGAPAGYIGHDEGGVLTNAIRRNPFAVVVFDEIEKASAKVYDLMLQIMDEGQLTDGKGIPSSFRDAVIIMTSNIGVKECQQVENTIGFCDVNILTDDRRKKALEAALKNKFRPEFLNRIDETVHFMPLKKRHYLKIVDLEMEKVLTRLRQNEKITVTYNDKVKNFIYKKGIDEKFGARPLKRCIKKQFSNPLTKEILTEKIKKGDYVLTTLERGKVVFEVVKSADHEEPPFYLTKNATSEEE